MDSRVGWGRLAGGVAFNNVLRAVSRNNGFATTMHTANNGNLGNTLGGQGGKDSSCVPTGLCKFGMPFLHTDGDSGNNKGRL
jgi:hypothetical protein